MMGRLSALWGRKTNSEVLHEAYECYRDNLLVIAVALSHDVTLAEDAVHDVFVSFAENLDSFRLTGSLKAYLATCVANRVRDLMRSRQRRAAHLGHQGMLSDVEVEKDEPSRRVVCNEELQILSCALALIPHEQREVIVLHIHGKVRFRHIAKSLGISTNTAKGRYRYGIRKLRSILNGRI